MENFSFKYIADGLRITNDVQTSFVISKLLNYIH